MELIIVLHVTFSDRSPTMAGGLLALHREYFFHLGAYDPGMEVWGGENLEMSFRVSTPNNDLITKTHF